MVALNLRAGLNEGWDIRNPIQDNSALVAALFCCLTSNLVQVY